MSIDYSTAQVITIRNNSALVYRLYVKGWRPVAIPPHGSATVPIELWRDWEAANTGNRMLALGLLTIV